MKNKVAFKTIDNQILVFRIDKTKNEKIENNKEKIVQVYSFAVEQYNYARNNKVSNQIYGFDESVCFSCPFKGIKGKCYTHKYGQTSGFFSLLRSLPNLDEIDFLPANCPDDLLNKIAGKYVRFGTYGEPTILPINWIKNICEVSKNWTGYTHRFVELLDTDYKKYFMASVENEVLHSIATDNGWRTFYVTKSKVSSLVHCPASKENDKGTNCSKCGLCSGSEGKGKKSVFILEH